MGQAIQTIAAIIAIIFTPIGCWLAYKNIPKDRVEEIKSEFKFAKEIISFLLVIVALAVLFMHEALSADPITRISIAKMCFYSSLAVLWVLLHALLFLINMGKRHAEVMLDHANVTKAHTEIIARHLDITDKLSNRIE